MAPDAETFGLLTGGLPEPDALDAAFHAEYAAIVQGNRPFHTLVMAKSNFMAGSSIAQASAMCERTGLEFHPVNDMGIKNPRGCRGLPVLNAWQ